MGRGYKITMVAMEEGKINVLVKLKREQQKTNVPPTLLGHLPASMTYQQLLEQQVFDVPNITATSPFKGMDNYFYAMVSFTAVSCLTSQNMAMKQTDAIC